MPAAEFIEGPRFCPACLPCGSWLLQFLLQKTWVTLLIGAPQSWNIQLEVFRSLSPTLLDAPSDKHQLYWDVFLWRIGLYPDFLYVYLAKWKIPQWETPHSKKFRIMRAAGRWVRQTKIMLGHCSVPCPLRHSSQFFIFLVIWNFVKESFPHVVRGPWCHTLAPFPQKPCDWEESLTFSMDIIKHDSVERGTLITAKDHFRVNWNGKERHRGGGGSKWIFPGTHKMPNV